MTSTLDLLSSLRASGIIDVSQVELLEYEMKKRKVLDAHRYKIWQADNGDYLTHVTNEDGKRKLIRKKNEADLLKALESFYRLGDSFGEVYNYWREYKDALMSSNSAARYDSDYKRYFKDTKFERMSMSKMSEDDVVVFIRKNIDKHKMTTKSIGRLISYIRGTFQYGIRRNIIEKDVTFYLSTKDFKKFSHETPVAEKAKIMDETIIDRLRDRLEQDHIKNPSFMSPYAVELALLTGFRVGELAALRWDHITDDYIIIDSSEHYDRQTHSYYIGKTKTGNSRKFPMTKQIKELLLRIREQELDDGTLCEWVFADENGRVNKDKMSSCMQNKCKQLGIQRFGIHACRKTFNSKMRSNGVSATMAASLLGHTVEVNERYYTFDNSSFDEKCKAVADYAL